MAAPGSLTDCERLLKLLLRRKRDTMLFSAQHEIQRIRTMTPSARVPSSLLGRHSATWLLWAMSWRGVSTAQNLFTEALHPPTLLVTWLSRTPAWLRFAPAG